MHIENPIGVGEALLLVTEIKGNIHTAPLPEGLDVERVALADAERVKRVLRVRTDRGRELGIRLPVGTPDLKDGDLLYLDEKEAIVVEALPTDVLVIKPRSIVEMGTVAHSLGNRHLPAQFFGHDSDFQADVMVVEYDPTVQQYLDSVGVPYAREQRVMPTPFRHAEHTH